MELLQRYRRSILNAFAKEFDELDRELTEELVRRDTIAAGESPKVRAQALVDRCPLPENGTTADPCSNTSVTDGPSGPAAGVLETTSTETTTGHVQDFSRNALPSSRPTDDSSPTVSRQDYERLSRKLEHLSKRYDVLLAAHQEVLARFRSERHTIKAWIKYHRRQREKRQAKEAVSADRRGQTADGEADGSERRPSDAGLTLSPEPPTPNDLGEEWVEPAIPFGDEVINAEQANKSVAADARNREAESGEERRSDRSTSGPTSEAVERGPKGSAGLQGIDEVAVDGESSGEVVFVSSREVRKRRRAVEGAPERSEMSSRPIQFKQEVLSSSPVVLYSSERAPPGQDSLDLDEVGEKVATPRKRRRFDDYCLPGSTWPRVEDNHTSVDGRCVPENDDSVGAMQTTRSFPAPVRESFASDSPDSRNHRDARASSEPPAAPPESDSGRCKVRDRVLKDKTTNVRVLPMKDGVTPSGDHVADASADKGMKPMRHEFDARRTKDVSHRGDAMATPVAGTTSARRRNRVGIEQGGRQTPVRRPTLQTSATMPVMRDRIGPPSPEKTPAGNAPVANGSSKGRNRPGRAALLTPDSSRPGLAERAEDEPYRARPLHRLSLEHFRIDPTGNQGLDYAFTETVRTQEQRRCLAGCTQKGCCGQTFRKVAELGLPTPQRSAPRWRSSSPDGSHNASRDDESLVRSVLNISPARFRCMSEEERREALLRARTKQFADQHGRHRQAFERRPTPPGFWRTDMPTSQEEREDREAAHRLEREKVRERLQEALRPGSRWKFRDE